MLKWFSRIQNLHISQTILRYLRFHWRLVEFKIYISLKHNPRLQFQPRCLVEFKIYISLKQQIGNAVGEISLVEFKIYISLKPGAKLLDGRRV